MRRFTFKKTAAVLSAIVVLAFYCLLTRSPIYCYDNNTANLLVNISSSPPLGKKKIFFVESSCESSNRGDIVLSPRQACAVESAAKTNPNTEVTLLFTSPIPLRNLSESQNNMVHMLLKYGNIKMKHANLADYFKGTSLEELYLKGDLKKSQYPVSHASDLLRYVTLWKYGGTYLDLDVVVMKSFENISNFVGAESLWAVAAGAMNFEQDSFGHDVATDCVNELKNTFDSQDWGNNGPGVITRVMKNLCGTEEVSEMTEQQCKSFKVLVPSMFYPIPWRDWKSYFDEEQLDSTMKKIQKSYAIHVWNKHSAMETVRVGSNQPYGVIASKFCPHVYANCGTEF